MRNWRSFHPVSGNRIRHGFARRPVGFSLVELLVALVVGLIVIGAVLALVVSMMRANNQTIQATRLTQELRATAVLVATEIQRAGAVADPYDLESAKQYGLTEPAFPTSGGAKVTYRYDGLPNYRSLELVDGTIRVAPDGITLNSDVVEVTALEVTRPNARQIIVTVSGRLRDVAESPVRSFSRSVFSPALVGS